MIQQEQNLTQVQKDHFERLSKDLTFEINKHCLTVRKY